MGNFAAKQHAGALAAFATAALSLLAAAVALALLLATPKLACADEGAVTPEGEESATATVASSNAESEPNDKISTSNKITLNTVWSGSLDGETYSTDSDWYKFTLPSDGYVDISFDKTNADDLDSGYSVSLKNADGDSLYWSGVGRTPSLSSSGIGLAKGTYYLCLQGSSARTSIGYTFKVQFTASSTWEKEPNDKTAICTAITTDTTWHGSLASDDSYAGNGYYGSDWYKFTLPSNGCVSISFSKSNADDSDNSYTIVLQNADGERVLYELSRDSSLSTSSIELSKGTYYLNLGGDNEIGNYSFKVAYVNFDTTAIMYRLYNPNSGEHFYTASSSEKDGLVKVGWNYEGVGWYAPKSSGTPVYRMYNPNPSPKTGSGEHHYTTSWDEKTMLENAGWTYESIGWYSDDGESAPLYRLYNPNEFNNNHHYTTSVSERDNLLSLGWRDEGIAWYGVADGHEI